MERILDNITKIHENLLKGGFNGTESISFHVYKFNRNEIESAENFARRLEIDFNPYYPYFNGNSMAEQFLDKTMDIKTVEEANTELYLSHVPQLLGMIPKDYRCFLENILSIDFDGGIVLCCAADAGVKDYYWKSIFQFDSFELIKEYRKEMLKCNSCAKCRSLGIDYWMEYNPSYEMGK